MRPATGQTVDRPDLGAVAFEYLLGGVEYIAGRLMPIFEVPEQSMQYPIIPIESTLKQRQNLKRATRSGYARADWQFEMDTFACEEYGWEEVIDDRERALYARFFDQDAIASEIAMHILMRDQEARVAALMTASTNTTAAGVAWSTPATATPRQNVQAGKDAMRDNFGIVPNAIAMSKKTFDALTATHEIRDYLQYTTPHLMMGREAKADTIARYFELDQVLIGDVQEDTAKRGKSVSLSEVWTNTEAYLCRVSDGGPNLRQPSVGRTFLWTGDAPSEVVVETYREEQSRGDVVRVRTNTDEKVQYAGAIHKITGVGS